MDEIQRRIELWKAIHGGCWPGPPPDNRLTQAANEVLASLALMNLARTFSDTQFGKQLHGAAAEHLAKALPALQQAGHSNDHASRAPVSGLHAIP